jgi:hypothetical protein
MKLICIVFIFVLFLPLIDAVKLGTSNSKLDFNIGVNEESCKRIEIGTDYIGPIVGELKFTKNNLKNDKVSDYKLDSDYFKISSKYEKEIIFDKPGNKETSICIIGKNPGNYRALLIYKTKNNNAAIGIFVSINIKNEGYDKTKIGLILTPSIFLSLLLFILLVRKLS